MRKASYGKRNRLKSIFTWCVCLVVCCLLALTGTNFFAPKPVEALCVIQPPPAVYECQNVFYTFQAYSDVGSYMGPDKYQCLLQGGMQGDTPFPAGLSFNGNTLSGCPPPGSAGTYEFHFNTMEQVQKNGTGPWINYGSGVKGVFFTILKGPPGCTCTGGTSNVPQVPPTPTMYKFTVSIGPGLTEGKTEVLVDGKKKADLGGGESKEFQAAIGTSPTVSVKSPITGQTGNRFTVKDAAEKKVSEGDTSAYFDYAPAVYIEFATDPPGLTALPGSDWYSIGDRAQSSAPATVDSGKPGTQLQFAYWALPNGQKSQMRSLSLTASAPATVTAVYDTYHKLTVSSGYGEDDTTWHKAGEEAAWQVKTSQVPMEGFLGLLGGKMKAVNPNGKTTMDGPKNITVDYKPSYPWFVLLLIAAVVIGGGFFAYRRLAVARAAAPPAPATAEAPAAEPVTKVKAATKAAAPPAKQAVAKKAAPKTKPAAESNFCPKCGDPVAKGADFCSKCGKKL